MLHLLLIAMVVSLHADDALGGSLRLGLSAPAGVAATLGAQATVALLAMFSCARCAMRLARSGDTRWLSRAQRTTSAARVAAVLVHVASIVSLGWLDAVRGALGDWVLLDEAVACAPALLTITASWLAFAPVERLLWQGSLVRTLDDGLPLHPPRGALRYALDQFRHGAAIILIPLAIIWSWGECVALLAARAGWVETDAGALAMSALQLAGVGVAFVVTPPIMVRVWRTVSLGPGELRARLEAMCARHGVRCRDIRVWRTDGAMLNGAVMGIFAPVRYILLTDALLESLPGVQVEAVAAHEIAHIRRRHLPWLIGAMLASLWAGAALVTFPAEAIAAALGVDLAGTALDAAVRGGAVIASIVCAGLVFGVVSRAFERQADAFAAQSLSGLHDSSAGLAEGASRVITPEATRAMAGALGAVARLNAIPAQRFFWRHGSINARRRRILALEGLPVERTPADRAAGRIKLAILATLGALAIVEGLIAIGTML